MSRNNQRSNSMLRIALLAVFLLLGLGQALGYCASHVLTLPIASTYPCVASHRTTRAR